MRAPNMTSPRFVQEAHFRTDIVTNFAVFYNLAHAELGKAGLTP
jgi:hypothetical protein